MSAEFDFIELLRGMANHPAARGLADDTAVLSVGGEQLILTHDAMVTGVHFFADADPADVAWKLVAVNLSDLAAKGAEPLGVLLGYTLSDADWDRRFAEGLHEALTQFDVPLLGGDTVSANIPDNSMQGARSFGMTAIGKATTAVVPSRSGAQPGDYLYITGQVGGAYAAYKQLAAGNEADQAVKDALLRPIPALAEGRALAPFVSAMMDVSDGLLLDASRMAKASGLALHIELDSVPFDSAAAALLFPDAEIDGGAAFAVSDKLAELAKPALTFGDDYRLIFAVCADTAPPVPAWPLGKFVSGDGLHLTRGGQPWPLPAGLGFEHR